MIVSLFEFSLFLFHSFVPFNHPHKNGAKITFAPTFFYYIANLLLFFGNFYLLVKILINCIFLLFKFIINGLTVKTHYRKFLVSSFSGYYLTSCFEPGMCF